MRVLGFSGRNLSPPWMLDIGGIAEMAAASG